MAQFPERIPEAVRRTLEMAGFSDLEQLSDLSEADLIELHGLGPSELMLLKEALAEHGLTFSEQPQGAMTSPGTVGGDVD